MSIHGADAGSVLYKVALRRALFLIVLAFLIVDTSGLDALVLHERCTSIGEQVPDSDCPATCVRCACGQPIVAVVTPLASVATVVVTVVVPPALELASSPARDIFHVPKAL